MAYASTFRDTAGRLHAVAALTAVLLSAKAHQARAAKVECEIATKGASPVAKACAEGGKGSARKEMKRIVKAGRDVGFKVNDQTLDCSHCHDANEWALKDDARKTFRALLKSIDGK
jgi:hypothetical protein